MFAVFGGIALFVLVCALAKPLGDLVSAIFSVALACALSYGIYRAGVWFFDWLGQAYDNAVLAISHTYMAALQAIGF